MNQFVSLYQIDQEAGREWRSRLIRFWLKYAFFVAKLGLSIVW